MGTSLNYQQIASGEWCHQLDCLCSCELKHQTCRVRHSDLPSKLKERSV